MLPSFFFLTFLSSCGKENSTKTLSFISSSHEEVPLKDEVQNFYLGSVPTLVDGSQLQIELAARVITAPQWDAIYFNPNLPSGADYYQLAICDPDLPCEPGISSYNPYLEVEGIGPRLITARACTRFPLAEDQPCGPKAQMVLTKAKAPPSEFVTAFKKWKSMQELIGELARTTVEIFKTYKKDLGEVFKTGAHAQFDALLDGAISAGEDHYARIYSNYSLLDFKDVFDQISSEDNSSFRPYHLLLLLSGFDLSSQDTLLPVVEDLPQTSMASFLKKSQYSVLFLMKSLRMFLEAPVWGGDSSLNSNKTTANMDLSLALDKIENILDDGKTVRDIDRSIGTRKSRIDGLKLKRANTVQSYNQYSAKIQSARAQGSQTFRDASTSQQATFEYVAAQQFVTRDDLVSALERQRASLIQELQTMSIENAGEQKLKLQDLEMILRDIQDTEGTTKSQILQSIQANKAQVESSIEQLNQKYDEFNQAVQDVKNSTDSFETMSTKISEIDGKIENLQSELLKKVSDQLDERLKKIEEDFHTKVQSLEEKINGLPTVLDQKISKIEDVKKQIKDEIQKQNSDILQKFHAEKTQTIAVASQQAQKLNTFIENQSKSLENQSQLFQTLTTQQAETTKLVGTVQGSLKELQNSVTEFQQVTEQQKTSIEDLSSEVNRQRQKFETQRAEVETRVTTLTDLSSSRASTTEVAPGVQSETSRSSASSQASNTTINTDLSEEPARGGLKKKLVGIYEKLPQVKERFKQRAGRIQVASSSIKNFLGGVGTKVSSASKKALQSVKKTNLGSSDLKPIFLIAAVGVLAPVLANSLSLEEGMEAQKRKELEANLQDLFQIVLVVQDVLAWQNESFFWDSISYGSKKI